MLRSAVMGTRAGPCGRGTAVIGVHSGDQPRLSGLRRKASPTLNPITSTTPHVSFGRGKAKWVYSGSRELPGKHQLFSCLKKTTKQPAARVSFHLVKRLEPSSQGRHWCCSAGPWHAPEGGQSPPIPSRDAHQQGVLDQQGSPSPLAPGCLRSAASYKGDWLTG